MTSNQQFFAALAIAIGAYWVGKKQALAAAAKPTENANIAGAAEWWSYAGTWGM
ncbi:MAG TPA: hypothetical protein VNU71_14600 [Burkholderiaceae bacterium]|nr:hypothetical protein [Burkholderiaceae bacterium]